MTSKVLHKTRAAGFSLRETLYVEDARSSHARADSFAFARRRISGAARIPRHETTPKGNRTPVAGMKSRCPRPLDDGGKRCLSQRETSDIERGEYRQQRRQRQSAGYRRSAGARIPSRTRVRGNPFPRTAGTNEMRDGNPAENGDEIGISSQRVNRHVGAAQRMILQALWTSDRSRRLVPGCERRVCRDEGRAPSNIVRSGCRRS